MNHDENPLCGVLFDLDGVLVIRRSDARSGPAGRRARIHPNEVVKKRTAPSLTTIRASPSAIMTENREVNAVRLPTWTDHSLRAR